ncbi:hypothetical protein HY949_04510 [Candidatus Gottesmanbacteria bacterium]|nr:hypothetical protein [Candidatus Gottesmanbacteria bacterium]
MTQVSKRLLRKDIENRIYEVLLESIASVKSKGAVDKLLDDLLSPTEKMMLAKRVAIALLLEKKQTHRTIATYLRVGLETVSKVSRVMQKGTGGYGSVVSGILRNEKLISFLEKMDDAIAELFKPHRDWSSWRKARWEAKIGNRKPF